MIDLMMDIETLSTRPDAAVFEVAVVPFQPERADTLHVTFIPDTGHIDVGTVRYWLRRADTCQLRAAEDTEALAVQRIYKYLKQFDDQVRLWAMPPSFDCVIVEQLLQRHGLDMPIGFRQWRDVRTMRDYAGWPKPVKPDGHVSHNALCDANYQIITLKECWLRRGS